MPTELVKAVMRESVKTVAEYAFKHPADRALHGSGGHAAGCWHSTPEISEINKPIHEADQKDRAREREFYEELYAKYEGDPVADLPWAREAARKAREVAARREREGISS